MPSGEFRHPRATVTYDTEFVSRQRQVGGRLFDERLRLRGSGGLGHLAGISLGSLTLEYDRYALSQGGQREEYRPRWRHRVGPVRLSHELDHIRVSGAMSTSYRLLGSYRRGPFTSRAQVRADGRQLDDLTVSSVSGLLDYRFDDGRTLGGNANYNVAGGDYSIGARFSEQLPMGQLGVFASSNDHGE